MDEESGLQYLLIPPNHLLRSFQKVDKDTSEEVITVPSKDRECQKDGE